MGQYYKPICLDTQQFLETWSYNQGAKLMEHSWIGNTFVGLVENLIAKGGGWHGLRIVWAGDYADPEPYGELDDKTKETNNLYQNLVDENEIKPELKKKRYRFLVNMDTNEFVDMNKVPVSSTYKKTKFRIHPLPLLTCEGNGRGGGDYHKENPLIGKWARQRITIQNTKPKNKTEVIFDLVE
jgi:hypothetical protein